MTEPYLKEGEMERLHDYLMYLEYEKREDMMDGILEQADKKDMQTLSELVAKYDQNTATIRNYENDSSFGETEEGIVQNAEKHFRSCPRCRVEYKLYVLSWALRLSDKHVKRFESTRIGPLQSFEEGFKSWAKKFDYFGLLNPQDLYID